MKVKDYMKKNPVTIEKKATFAQAVEKMVEEKANALVVIDSKEKQHPIGVLTMLIIIKKVLPSYIEMDPSITQFAREGGLSCLAIKAKDLKVEDIMFNLEGKFKIDLHPEDAMVEAAAYAGKNTIRTLPVIDDENRLVGVIDRTCIKHAIYNAIFKEKNPDCAA